LTTVSWSSMAAPVRVVDKKPKRMCSIMTQAMGVTGPQSGLA
jgi:hypothetical protein